MVVSSWCRAVFAACGVAVGLAAQRPLASFETDARAVHLDRLCVKLAEGTAAELKAGALVSRTGVALQPVAAQFARLAARPLVTSVARAELDRWHALACAALPPHNRPGNLGLWFHLSGDPAVVAAVRDVLRREPLVADVHHEPRWGLAGAGATALPPPGGDIPPTTPLLTNLQLTHNPNPQGHGVLRSAGVLGARGRGVRFVMMEGTFLLGHEDVGQLVAANFLGPVPTPDPASMQHGCSGASMVVADRNGYGLTGMADEVEARFLSMPQFNGFENSVAFAVANTQPGDVVLAVVIVPAPTLGPNTWIPFEYYQAAFDATLTATGLGRHVVVPGGNGNLSLDDPALMNRFDRSFRDSGAVMVAASQPGPLLKIGFSNWGSRIDAHSWGDGVASCGYPGSFFPNNDLLQAYTYGATGTSASTPQLAGVVSMIQGAAKRQLGQTLSNQQLLALLHTHGATTPDQIGRRPDVEAILTALGAIDGLRLDAPDFGLSDTMTVTMEGPVGSIAALFASFLDADLDLGFNRHVHLDLNGMAPCGTFFLTGGTATWQLQVPNNPALSGADLYFQVVRLAGTAPLHVTNSCQATVR